MTTSDPIPQADPDTANLAERAGRLKWYHRMALPGGVMTDGVSDTSRGLPRLHLPPSLAGKTVLDVGAWDGFYSFEAARRGAAHVLATDSWAWSGSGWGTKDGFLLARAALGLEDRVQDQLVDVMDLSPSRVGGPFDVVLLLGVLYHLTDPVTALARVASVCGDLLVLETETALNWLPFPVARLYPGGDLGEDESNWFAFNVQSLTGLLRRLGFVDIQVKWRTSLPRRVVRAAVRRPPGHSVRSSLRSARLVLHARR
jgi:tRNA (mo5U34)-methyltransferase